MSSPRGWHLLQPQRKSIFGNLTRRCQSGATGCRQGRNSVRLAKKRAVARRRFPAAADRNRDLPSGLTDVAAEPAMPLPNGSLCAFKLASIPNARDTTCGGRHPAAGEDDLSQPERHW
jgi:hypothetical protein